MLNLETIMKDSIWVAKMNGWRESGTYDQIGHLFNDEDCRDFDLCAEQPEHLKEFYDMYFKHDGFITIQDFYKDYYVKSFDSEKPKRVWTEEEISNLIQNNDKVLYKALIKLFSFQTDSEQKCDETHFNNGVGFNHADAPFLSSVAKFVMNRGYLTDKQKYVTRKRLVKYNKQLTRIANAG